eukprot:gene23778-30046_t
MKVANLDPAAEYFDYDASFDIRNLVQLEQVMEEFGYGPNEVPHINVITKCDIADKEAIARVLDSESAGMINMLDRQSNSKLKSLTRAMSSIVDDYMIVSFVMLDVSDEDSIEEVLGRTDHAIQYGEDVEPREPRDEDMGDEEY